MAKLENTFSINLNKKVILITGGYGYLGKAITESLLSHNARVFVLGRDENKFYKVFEGNENLDKNLLFEFCDISETKSIKKAFSEISQTSTVNALINNAFYLTGQSPEKMNDEDWAQGIDGNLNSVFRTIREIIPYFKRAGEGKIINVSSMYGMVAPDFKIYDESPKFLNPPHYGAAKAGVIQLTKYYAAYLGKWNIKVNAVSPGPFPSQKVQEDLEFINELKQRTCLDRIGQPEDLGGIFTFLSSDASDFITGQNFTVDGGWTSK
ncbi:SDR family oxidoreductase [Salegentibacter sp. JZCK2]|uniref:SDR family oxidoreductase n=1 Tax=Salegentibacter tibetensis TaxID=2873600 RepID=UPI001CD0148A|nr:SDR family oxidoreductase [Salegentibacter tibetensis]MBZ9729077.1 SDR family oxidoreductase [Salegentibacter tibetensis]